MNKKGERALNLASGIIRPETLSPLSKIFLKVKIKGAWSGLLVILIYYQANFTQIL
jgi:hypothetical protein